MSTFLPLFPLELVVFPGEKLNLHIFEDRYKQLVSETYNNTSTFGIPTFMNDKIMDFGTEVEVIKIDKIYPDGKMDINTRGLRTFKLLEYFPIAEGVPYPGGFVEFDHEMLSVKNEDEAADETEERLKELLRELARLLDVSNKIIPPSRKNMSFRIAHYLGMPLEEEYELLITKGENNRQKKIIHYLESAIPDIKQRELMKTKIALNGHFKHIHPPKI